MGRPIRAAASGITLVDVAEYLATQMQGAGSVRVNHDPTRHMFDLARRQLASTYPAQALYCLSSNVFLSFPR